MKNGTIIDYPDSNLIRNIKYSVSPRMFVTVKTKNTLDLPKLVNGLKKL